MSLYKDHAGNNNEICHQKTEKNKNDKMCYIANTSVDLSAESNMERPDAGVTV